MDTRKKIIGKTYVSLLAWSTSCAIAKEAGKFELNAETIRLTEG
jgi:hypothetical protein